MNVQLSLAFQAGDVRFGDVEVFDEDSVLSLAHSVGHFFEGFLQSILVNISIIPLGKSTYLASVTSIIN